MKNCFIKKYNGEFNVKDPIYFDAINYRATGNVHLQCFTDIGEGLFFKIIGDGHFADSSYQSLGTKEYKQALASSNTYYTGTEYEILIYTKGDIKSFKPYDFDYANGTLDIDIDKFGFLTYIETFNFKNSVNTNSIKVRGNIKSLGSCTILNTINGYYTDIEGSVESFVASQVRHGRTSKEGFLMQIPNNKVTFNNKAALSAYLDWSVNGSGNINVRMYKTGYEETITIDIDGNIVS